MSSGSGSGGSGGSSSTADAPDILIAGAGMAGLFVARELLRRQPGLRVLLIEKYSVVGGRVLSFRKCLEGLGVPAELVERGCGSGADKPPLWEAGAGRLHYSQKRIHKLLEEYHMKVIPISSSTDFIGASASAADATAIADRQPNQFDQLADAFLPPLADLPVADLQMNTLADICKRIYGSAKFFEQFPYYTEVHNLRADEALATFRSVMGSTSGFCIPVGGFGQLPAALAADVRRRGGSIWLGAELVDFDTSGGLKATVRLWRAGKPHTTVAIRPKRLILALHAAALKKLPACRTWTPLQHVGTSRLLRIYAIFPLDRRGRPWFAGMPKTVVAGPLRYVIPISEEHGIIMISYTDGGDVMPFWSAAEATDSKLLTRMIMREVRTIFGANVPWPLFLKAHPWSVGTSYWRPGRYDIDAVMKESLHVAPSVYACGESFSHDQAWIEGALESAELLLATPEFRKP
jgi:glycine/D-amino acid oxidase-like deaminating enzyme